MYEPTRMMSAEIPIETMMGEYPSKMPGTSKKKMSTSEPKKRCESAKSLQPAEYDDEKKEDRAERFERVQAVGIGNAPLISAVRGIGRVQRIKSIADIELDVVVREGDGISLIRTIQDVRRECLGLRGRAGARNDLTLLTRNGCDLRHFDRFCVGGGRRRAWSRLSLGLRIRERGQKYTQGNCPDHEITPGMHQLIIPFCIEFYDEGTLKWAVQDSNL